ncbi:phage head-tail connector protein [Agrobacterium radiobacter]|uniref:head-tail connector protein n=1 Tax=Agrobacterium radiobacter TaxID=362 RepID=UPI0034673E7F
MHRPVLVTAPTVLPVSVADVKKALRIDSADDDDLIESLIRAAVDYYEGWTGILGRCLVEQTWRQSYDRFDQVLCLPLGPAIEPVSVSWRNASGQISTVPDESYSLETSAGGQSVIRFRNAFSQPSDLYERGAVTVEYKAGWPIVEGKPTVPKDICTAIIARVQIGYEQSATEASATLSVIENALISKWRRFSL